MKNFTHKSLLIALVIFSLSGCKSYMDNDLAAHSLASTICNRIHQDCAVFDPSLSANEQDVNNYSAANTCEKSMEKDIANYMSQNSLKVEYKVIEDCNSALGSSSIPCKEFPLITTSPPEACAPLRGWFVKAKL